MFDAQLGHLARSLVLATLSQVQNGRLTLILNDQKDSETLHFGKQSPEFPDATVTVHDERAFANEDKGFSEGYMSKQIDCDNLVNIILLYIHNAAVLGQGHPIISFIPRVLGLVLKSTNGVVNSLKNASFHYDTSNELFTAFLSPDMNYSSAIWSSDSKESLETAQKRKIVNLIDKARLQPHHHVLDIGCGWGNLAMEAVRRSGCRVTGVTLSREQKSLAEQRIREAKLSDKIEIILCDYRKVPRPVNGFDRIISVEMLEHVGAEHMDEYFASISSLLNPTSGIMVIQGITIINEWHDTRKNQDNFIERYVFPGGYLPSVNKLLTSIHDGSKGQLEVESVQSIGHHYAKTLHSWCENFEKNWPAIEVAYRKQANGKASEQEVEFFRRRWLLYFQYCEAGFRAGTLGDHIISAVRRPLSDSLAL